MKKFVRALLLLIFPLMADEKDEIAYLPPHPEFCYECEESFRPPCFPPTARGCLVDYGFYLTVDFLYLKTIEEQLCYTGIITPVSPALIPTSLFQEEIVDLDFDWDPGFRIGAGYNFCHDYWDFRSCWMYQYTKPSSCITLDGPHLSLLITQDQGHDTEKLGVGCATKACASWEMRLNALDLELGKSYCLGCAFSIRPFFGLKAAWIDQKFNVDYEDIFFVDQGVIGDFLGTTKFEGEAPFWGVGPRVGANTKWILGCNFDIFANIAGSLLSGCFDPKGKTNDHIHVVQNYKRDSRARLRPVAEILVGIEWGRCIGDCYFFNIGVGYEAHYYWQQLQIPFPGNVFPDAGLSLHGLNVNARFEF